MKRKRLTTIPESCIEKEKVNLAKITLLDHPKAAFHHGRVGWPVGADPALTDQDVRVYWAMGATCWETNIFRGSTRWIARNTGGKISQSEVVRSQHRLEGAGHAERLPTKRGQKSAWRLLSPVFGDHDTLIATEIIPVERLTAVRKGKKCGKCGKLAAAIGSSGVCSICLADYAKRAHA